MLPWLQVRTHRTYTAWIKYVAKAKKERDSRRPPALLSLIATCSVLAGKLTVCSPVGIMQRREPKASKADSDQPALVEEEDSDESEEEQQEGVDVHIEVDLAMVGSCR
jgi:hypothetical protein